MKKLYRATITIDTLVYMEPEDAEDECLVVDACQDAMDICNGTDVEVQEIDWTKPVYPDQFPAFWEEPDLVPENGGPTIGEIAKENNHRELWISHRPD